MSPQESSCWLPPDPEGYCPVVQAQSRGSRGTFWLRASVSVAIVAVVVGGLYAVGHRATGTITVRTQDSSGSSVAPTTAGDGDGEPTVTTAGPVATVRVPTTKQARPRVTHPVEDDNPPPPTTVLHTPTTDSTTGFIGAVSPSLPVLTTTASTVYVLPTVPELPSTTVTVEPQSTTATTEVSTTTSAALEVPQIEDNGHTGGGAPGSNVTTAPPAVQGPRVSPSPGSGWYCPAVNTTRAIIGKSAPFKVRYVSFTVDLKNQPDLVGKGLLEVERIVLRSQGLKLPSDTVISQLVADMVRHDGITWNYSVRDGQHIQVPVPA
jgi:hypothetical protein